MKVARTDLFEELVEEEKGEHRLTEEILKDLERKVGQHPELGDIIPGTGGLQKYDMKSVQAGARDSYRVLYYVDRNEEGGGRIYLMELYWKPKKEKLTEQEKAAWKGIIENEFGDQPSEN